MTALTRPHSTNTVPAGAAVAHVDYDDPASLVAALQGQHALVLTMAVNAPPQQTLQLIEAAASARVGWVFPNEFGIDVCDPTVFRESLLGSRYAEVRECLARHGVRNWVGITCGFWYEFSLGGGPERFGFDLAQRSVVLYDEGATKINTTTFPQVGRAVAGLLSLKVQPEHADDSSPCLERFRGKQAFISSFQVSQKDLLDSVLRATKTKITDWQVSHETSKQRYEAGVKELHDGNMMSFAKALYSRVFFNDGTGDYQSKYGLHNDLLGLPEEDLDELTQQALEFHQQSQGRKSVFGRD